MTDKHGCPLHGVAANSIVDVWAWALGLPVLADQAQTPGRRGRCFFPSSEPIEEKHTMNTRSRIPNKVNKKDASFFSTEEGL